MSKREKYLWFITIVTINIILKVLYCDYTPFSYDEIISVKDTLLDFGHIKHEAEWDNNPPFFYYCLWIWHKIIPISEFNTRLFSVILVAISIGLVFLFSQSYFNTKTSIFTVIILSLSNFITFYSQEARTYSLVLLLSIISSVLFFKYIKYLKIQTLLYLSLVNFLLIYSHYITGIILIIQYIFVLLFFKKSIKIYFTLQTFIIVSLVFLRFTKKQFFNIFNFNKKEDFWLKPASIEDLTSTFGQLFFNNFTAILFAVIFIYFLIKYYQERKDEISKIKLYCFFVGFASILLLFIIGIFKPIFLARYLIFAIPFATILFVNTLNRIPKLNTFILSIIIVMQIINLKIKKDSGVDYRSVAKIIASNKKTNDIVIINTRDNLSLFQYYYSNNDFMKYKSLDSICKTQGIFGINNIESLQEINQGENSTIFLIQSFHKLKGNANLVANYFSKKGEKIYYSNNLAGIELSIFNSSKNKSHN